MVSIGVPGFLPSKRGLHFENHFDQAPVITFDFPVLGSRGFGDASGGLCGGMVFAVHDLFEAGLLPPLDRNPPSPGTPLFQYLCSRLMASFNIPLGVLKYYQWMTWPDEDNLFVRGLRKRTVQDEWPRIQQELDAGRPAPLGLITVHSVHPEDLGHCHQILAYSYAVDEASGELRLAVYDPNWPDRDDLALVLNVSTPGPVDYAGGMPVRGFFLTPYHPNEDKPTLVALAGPPADGLA